MRFLFFCFMVFLVSGCVGDGEFMQYKASDISDVNFVVDGKEMTLFYSLPLETLFYSPGVDVVDSQDGLLIVVRKCSIDDKCKVDFQSEHVEGNREKVVITTKKSPSKVYLHEITPHNSIEYLVVK